MKPDDDIFVTAIIAWVVVITIIFGVLLPYTANVPTLSALFYKVVAERSTGSAFPETQGGQPGTDNPDGLLVYYDFNDDLFNTTDMIADISGNGNHAFPNGVFIRSAPGILGTRSLFLPGTGYLYCETDPAAEKTNVTFSLWFTVPDETHNYRLASALSTSGPRTGWVISTKSSEFWDSDGVPIRISPLQRSRGALPFAVVNHKAVVYNGSRVTEYLNGFVVSEYSASGEPLGTGYAMLIGSWQPFGQNYAGRIDDFRIYNRALNETEVLGLYRPEQGTGSA